MTMTAGTGGESDTGDLSRGGGWTGGCSGRRGRGGGQQEHPDQLRICTLTSP